MSAANASSPETDLTVAWIGMGRIGLPMALRVLAAGYPVVGYARDPARRPELAEAGGSVTGDLTAALSGARLICVNLYSEDQARAVLLTEGGLFAAPSGACFVIHSTVDPGFIRELAAARPDVEILDAGFSGSDEDAAQGHITLMIGGDPSALAVARPVLAAYANAISHVGPLGAGMTLKLINNLAFASQVAIARDALRVAGACGIAIPDAIRVMSQGSAGSYALNLLGRATDFETGVEIARPYLDKDVSIARQGTARLSLGVLEAASAEFGA